MQSKKQKTQPKNNPSKTMSPSTKQSNKRKSAESAGSTKKSKGSREGDTSKPTCAVVSTREEKLAEKKRTFVEMKNDPAVSKLDEADGTFISCAYCPKTVIKTVRVKWELKQLK